MAAPQIACADRGLARGARGMGARRFAREAKARDLRRNEFVGVQFPLPCPAREGRRMNPVDPRHVPVLGREAVEMLAPRTGGIYVDATFGAGGYSRAILAIAGTRVIGIDRDGTAIAGGRDLVERSEGQLALIEDRFSHLEEICAASGVSAVDGVVMDVGVSSMQLDQAGRGFSFRLEGPLDMRMGQSGPTAADVIAKASEAELRDIVYRFGEGR